MAEIDEKSLVLSDASFEAAVRAARERQANRDDIVGIVQGAVATYLRAEREAGRGMYPTQIEHDVREWARAYPLSAFPEPDFVKVRAALEAAGLTVDSVSASNMRHVITKIAAMFDAAASADQLRNNSSQDEGNSARVKTQTPPSPGAQK